VGKSLHFINDRPGFINSAPMFKTGTANQACISIKVTMYLYGANGAIYWQNIS
jgi:hypothetical protein